MPIKDKSVYSPNWREVSRYIRFVRAKGKCGSCGAIHGQRLLFSKGTIYLAAAHLNHTPGDDRRSNLRALCQRCHLAHYHEDNARRAALTRFLKRLFRQPTLFSSRKGIRMPIDARAIEGFRGYSPQEGDPDCKCSWCRQVIGTPVAEWPDDEDCGPELAIRLWRGSGRNTEEARFHIHCFNDVLWRGILQLKTGDSQ